jgi:hypothetical protein
MTEEANVEQAVAADHTQVELAYAAPSLVETTARETQVRLVGNLRRPPVRLEALVKKPLRFREALSALYAVVGSDFRYVPKDRAAYAGYLRMKRESAGLNVWQAQQAYFTWLLRNDPLAFVILDPVITVHPDRVFFEVFSKDEGTYANLAIDKQAFDVHGTPDYGTTNIDYSQSLFNGIQQMRSYRETRLSIGQEAVTVATAGAPEVLEKKINIPDSWLRGFLQVQSATALPMDHFALAPIDLYNVLRHLRFHADKKGKRRGLRVELVPGQLPRLVLEPWDVVQPASTGTFKGRAARVVRVWGRRRLMLLRRLLPLLTGVDVYLLGSGLPSFWVFRAGEFTLTLGITGFTTANWSQAINFDLLLPRKTQTGQSAEAVVNHLSKAWFADAKELTNATGLKGPALTEAVQLGCQQGRVMYDLAHDVYRLRPLTETPLDLEKLEYRNSREKTAHDLLVRRNAVKMVSENQIAGTGLELTAQVTVLEDKREYRPQMLLGDEGQVLKAECTCPLFRKQGLKDGPCADLVALRLAYAEEERQRAKSGLGRKTVTTETRAFSKRHATGIEEVMQLSLERQRLKIRWGQQGQPLRLQTLRFNTPDEARAAYFTRVDQLNAGGFLDATAS